MCKIEEIWWNDRREWGGQGLAAPPFWDYRSLLDSSCKITSKRFRPLLFPLKKYGFTYDSLYHNHNVFKSIDVSIYLIGTHQKKIYTKGFDPRNTLHSYLLTIWSVWKININQWKYCLYVFESMVLHFLRTGSCCMIPVSNL